jgi:hypothetical protein
VILAVAVALASPRTDGEAAEQAMDFAGAVAAYRDCAAHGSDRDVRFCETRLRVLAPQAADGFAGWRTLEEVRRAYRDLGADAAIARVEDALNAAPDAPAAAEMRRWLANERAKRGEMGSLEAMKGEPGVDAAWVERKLAQEATERRRRVEAGVGAALATVYAVAAARGPGALRWRSAALAGAMLGAVPCAFAALYEQGMWVGFARTGAAVGLAVLAAARAPAWVAVPGTLGALAAVAWWNGWYPSLGL